MSQPTGQPRLPTTTRRPSLRTTYTHTDPAICPVAAFGSCLPYPSEPPGNGVPRPTQWLGESRHGDPPGRGLPNLNHRSRRRTLAYRAAPSGIRGTSKRARRPSRPRPGPSPQSPPKTQSWPTTRLALDVGPADKETSATESRQKLRQLKRSTTMTTPKRRTRPFAAFAASMTTPVLRPSTRRSRRFLKNRQTSRPSSRPMSPTSRPASSYNATSAKSGNTAPAWAS